MAIRKNKFCLGTALEKFLATPLLCISLFTFRHLKKTCNGSVWLRVMIVKFQTREPPVHELLLDRGYLQQLHEKGVIEQSQRCVAERRNAHLHRLDTMCKRMGCKKLCGDVRMCQVVVWRRESKVEPEATARNSECRRWSSKRGC